MKLSKFWEKVAVCEHKNLTEDVMSGGCGTPYCRWEVVRCIDCNVWITRCQCGFCDSADGWSPYRRRAFERKKAEL